MQSHTRRHVHHLIPGTNSEHARKVMDLYVIIRFFIVSPTKKLERLFITLNSSITTKLSNPATEKQTQQLSKLNSRRENKQLLMEALQTSARLEQVIAQLHPVWEARATLAEVACWGGSSVSAAGRPHRRLLLPHLQPSTQLVAMRFTAQHYTADLQAGRQSSRRPRLRAAVRAVLT